MLTDNGRLKKVNIKFPSLWLENNLFLAEIIWEFSPVFMKLLPHLIQIENIL